MARIVRRTEINECRRCSHVLRPRDRAGHAAWPTRVPISTRTTTRSRAAATWAACSRCSPPRSTSRCSARPSARARDSARCGWPTLRCGAASFTVEQAYDGHGLEELPVREQALLRLAGRRVSGRRAGVRPARAPRGVKDSSHERRPRQDSGLRCRRPGRDLRADQPWTRCAAATTTPERTTSSSTESCASPSTKRTSASGSSRLP